MSNSDMTDVQRLMGWMANLQSNMKFEVNVSDASGKPLGVLRKVERKGFAFFPYAGSYAPYEPSTEKE